MFFQSWVFHSNTLSHHTHRSSYNQILSSGCSWYLQNTFYTISLTPADGELKNKKGSRKIFPYLLFHTLGIKWHSCQGIKKAVVTLTSMPRFCAVCSGHQAGPCAYWEQWWEHRTTAVNQGWEQALPALSCTQGPLSSAGSCSSPDKGTGWVTVGWCALSSKSYSLNPPKHSIWLVPRSTAPTEIQAEHGTVPCIHHRGLWDYGLQTAFNQEKINTLSCPSWLRKPERFVSRLWQALPYLPSIIQLRTLPKLQRSLQKGAWGKPADQSAGKSLI